MGDVIEINYPATRKFLALARREKRLIPGEKDDDLDDALRSLRTDTRKEILEIDELHFQEENRERTQILNGGLVLLFRYHATLQFIQWFKGRQCIEGNRFSVRLTSQIEPWILLESHDVDELLENIRNNTNHTYLDRIEMRVKNYLVEEKGRNEQFLRPLPE